MPTHLFALGEASYAGPNGGPSAMWRHILATTGKPHPRVCVIPTATGDRRDMVIDFVFAMNRLRAHPNFLALYSTPSADLDGWLMEFDAIYVPGGNTRNLIVLWREWGLDAALRRAWQRGVVILGASAGAICWHEQGNSDFIADQYNPIDGLGWLPGSVAPHYGDANGRRASFKAMVADGRLRPGYGLSDRGALHYVDGRLHEALSDHPDFGVYRVERGPDGTAVETAVPARQVS